MGPIGGTSSPSVLDLILENGNEMNIEILSISNRVLPKWVVENCYRKILAEIH